MMLLVLVLIIALISLFLTIKREREFKKTIESDKEFIEWRTNKSNKELKYLISRLEHEIFKNQKKIEFLNPRIKKSFFNFKREEVISLDRMCEIDEYKEKIDFIEQRIADLKGAITSE